MAGIQWKPEPNAITTPKSYKITYVPRAVVGYEELAAQISASNPNYNQQLVMSILKAMTEAIKRNLLEGNQVTLAEGFTYRLSFKGKLNQPTDPLPDDENLLQVRIYASQPFILDIRSQAEYERKPAELKVPVIAATEDTRTGLNNVLNPEGVLRLSGSNLSFDNESSETGCVIAGTESGSIKQSRFGMISNALVLMMPDIPAQSNPWNNEYTLSLSTRYTKHGSLRTTVFSERLRTPLAVDPSDIVSNGILTGSADSPYVRVSAASISGDTARTRIQVILNRQSGHLLFNLLDMEKNGKAGPAVTMTGNGTCTLAGYSGSPVSSVDIVVENFQGLSELLLNSYADRMVDILDITPSS